MGKQAEVAGRIAAAVSSLEGIAAEIERSTLGEDEIADALAAVRRAQRLSAGILAALGAQSLRLSAAGEGPNPEDALTADNGVPLATARVELNRATTLDRFPVLAESFRAGEIPEANLDVLSGITRRMRPEEIESLVGSDADLARAAVRLSTDSFRRNVSRLRDNHRTDGGKKAADQATDDSFARVAAARDKSGYRINGFLDPIPGASVRAAIDQEARRVLQTTMHAGLSGEQAAAQALHDLILRGDAANGLSETNRTSPGAPRANVNISVLVDRQTLEHGPHPDTTCETEGGLPVSPNQIGQLCCDAILRRVDTAPDGHVHVSQSVRTATAKQRAALRSLYPNCPLSGESWDHIEIHHVVFYEESKRTVLSELVPISRRWHHLIHDEGWRLDMEADRTLHLYRPDGTHERAIAPPAPSHVTKSSQDDHLLAA